MKVQRRSRGTVPLFLQLQRSTGVRGQNHAPAALPQEKTPGTYSTGGWLGPRDNVDGYGKLIFKVKKQPLDERISGKTNIKPSKMTCRFDPGIGPATEKIAVESNSTLDR